MRTLVLLVLLWSGVAARPAGATVHPPLVDVETTDCTVCHDVVRRGATPHAAATQSCTGCHEVSIRGATTEIGLTTPEPALCLTCHQEFAGAANLELELPHPPVAESCTSCHDPHAARQADLLKAPSPVLCGSCHSGKKFERKHGGQLPAIADCGQCHEAHGSNREHMFSRKRLHPPFTLSCAGCHREPFGDRVRLVARDERLCTGCHGGLTDEAEASQNGHGTVHAALDGRLSGATTGRPGCISCHDPHMSDQRKLLREKIPALCASCHSEIVDQALAPGGHPPAAADCRACHRPHAAAEDDLLTRPLETLCVGCHGSEATSTAHLGADLSALRCTNCHSPHGSEHPSQLARTLHPPVVDGCETCHAGAFDRQQEDGTSALCLRCHAEIGELAEQASVPHQALVEGNCKDCHNPHATPQDKLVKSPGAGPCLSCHQEKAPVADEKGHGVIDLVGCRACHEPHGGEREYLLRDHAEDLCRSCHDPARVRIDERSPTTALLDRFEVPTEIAQQAARLRLSVDGLRNHPVVGHRVSGQPTAAELRRVETHFEGELSCLSCHDPHKGRTKLLRWDVETTFQACTQCHPK